MALIAFDCHGDITPLLWMVVLYRLHCGTLLNMRRLVSLALLLGLMAAWVSGQEAGHGGLPWGSSVEEAKSVFGEPDRVDEEDEFVALVYHDVNLAGHTSDMTLAFGLDEFWTCIYEVSNIMAVVLIFDDIDAKLTELYGEPAIKEVHFSGRELYWHDIRDGEASLFTAWNAEGKTIIHTSSRDTDYPGSVSHLLSYIDPRIVSAETVHRNIYYGGL